jgi:hypothetical protein
VVPVASADNDLWGEKGDDTARDGDVGASDTVAVVSLDGLSTSDISDLLDYNIQIDTIV